MPESVWVAPLAVTLVTLVALGLFLLTEPPKLNVREFESRQTMEASEQPMIADRIAGSEGDQPLTVP
jgi:hypothetical protein